jgi:glucokinase
VEACTTALRSSLEEYLATGGTPPVALGISAPGPLDPRSGVLVDPPNLGSALWGLPLGPLLESALGLPVVMERDTHVAIHGERAFGAGAGLDDLVYLTISTGIGGAVITGGVLMTGPDGVAGELGHLTVDMDGEICACGGRGHLEGLTSGSGMARSAREAVTKGETAPELSRIAARIDPQPLEAHHVSEAAAAGDPAAMRIVDRAVRAFAAAVVSIVDVFNPARIIVGGGVAEAWGDGLLQPARELVARTAFRVQARRVELVAARLGPDVGLIGALPLVALALSATRQANQAELISASAVQAAAG